MNVLLDTQVWLWLLAQPQRFGSDAMSLLVDRKTEMYLSAASTWEIVIKYRLGRLPLPEPPGVYVPSRMRLTGVNGLAIEHSHALAVLSLEDHHRDPFDRILVAQAQVEGLSLVSADRMLSSYDIEVIDATA